MPWFEKCAPHHQYLARAICLEIAAGDHPVTEQEQAHVISVYSFGCRHVDLNRVFHSEHPLQTFAIPNERIERCDERSGVDGLGNAGTRMYISRLFPSVD